jgi:hypothetical protein
MNDRGKLRGYILGTTDLQPHKSTTKPYQNDAVFGMKREEINLM